MDPRETMRQLDEDFGIGRPPACEHDWIEGERITPTHSYWCCSKCGKPGPHDALDAARKPTHDTPEAALAAALDEEHLTVWRRAVGELSSGKAAAAILAALPPGWCGHEALMEGLEVRYRAKEAEIGRLRQRIAELEARL